jgi:hypothetical protein
MLPGGSGIGLPILAHLDGPGTSAFPPASRVSISELLCVKNVSTGQGRLSKTAHHLPAQAPAAAGPSCGRKSRHSPGTRHQPASPT